MLSLLSDAQQWPESVARHSDLPGDDSGESRASPLVRNLLVCAVMLAFIDESVRKITPGQPPLITAVKDAFLFIAGSIILVTRHESLRRYFGFFIPWALVTSLSAIWIYIEYGSILGCLATIRTYSLPILFFSCGYYLALDGVARRRVMRMFAIGVAAAMFCALLQQNMRDQLPAFLSIRLTGIAEQHSEAGGKYVESLFASPQVFAESLAVFAVFLVCWQIRTRGWRQQGLICAFIAGAVYCMFIARIRTALPQTALASLAVVFWLRRTAYRANRPLLRAVVAIVFFAVSAELVVHFATSSTELDATARDLTYFSRLLDPTEVLDRILFFTREFRDWPNHSALFGYGAGTGAMLRETLGIEALRKIPNLTDTGSALLFHEMGLAGMGAFLIGYVLLTLNCIVRVTKQRNINPLAFPACAVAAMLLTWFLFKSFNIIFNGFSHAMWMGCLGLAFGLIDHDANGGAVPAELPDAAWSEYPVEFNRGGYSGF